MGENFIDQYSLLHFAVGIIVYFFGINFKYSVAIHIIFEFFENTPCVMEQINKLNFWPGGKNKPDNIINSISDTMFFIFGWIVGNYVDIFYKK
jgi:hypothetical protein